MLQRDKKRIVQILRMLYDGNNYFRVKNESTIIIKPHFFSLRKIDISLDHVFNNLLPRSLKVIPSSIDLAEDYMQTLEEVKGKGMEEKIKVAFKFISELRSSTNFRGYALTWTYEESLREKVKDFSERTKEWFDALYLYIASEIELKYRSYKSGSIQIISVGAHSSSYIESMAEEFNNSMPKIELEVVGRILTGDTKFDSRLQKVWRFCYAGHT